MKAVTLRAFFDSDEPRIVSRVVYVYNILLVFRDHELPERDIYYALRSMRHTAWHDYSFFHVSRKRNLLIPAQTEAAVRKEIARDGLSDPEDTIRDYLWNDFRVSASDGVEEIREIEDIIVFRSKEYDANTACVLKYFNVRLSPKDMTRVVQNPQSVPFSETELRAMAAHVQFANPVQLWFAVENGARLSRAHIHEVETRNDFGEELTVLFSDMRDFSEMVTSTYSFFTNDRALHEFRTLCKRYQLVMCRAIRLQGGEIVQSAGDAFIAVFRGIDAPSRSLASARSMLSSVAALQRNVDFTSLRGSFATRIGLATGTAQIGYLGPYEMKELTVFGQCINIGSRLERAIKEYSPTGGILLTAETAEGIRDFNASEFQEISVAVKELGNKLKCYLFRSQN